MASTKCFETSHPELNKKYSTQDGVGHSGMNQKACYKHSP